MYDTQHYVNKAVELIDDSHTSYNADRHVATAQVYATLALAAAIEKSSLFVQVAPE